MAFQDFMKQLNVTNNPLGPDHLVNILGMTLPVGKFSLEDTRRFSETTISSIFSPLMLIHEHFRCIKDIEPLEKLRVSAEITRILLEVGAGSKSNHEALFYYNEKSVVVDLGLMKFEYPYDVLDSKEYNISIPEMGDYVIQIGEPKDMITDDLATRYYSTYLKLASIVIRYRFLSESEQIKHEVLLQAHRSKNKAASLLDLINPSSFFDAYVTAHLRCAINIMSDKFLNGTEEEKSEVTEAFRLSGLDGNPSLQILTEYRGREATHYMLFQYLDTEDQTQSFWVNINNI